MLFTNRTKGEPALVPSCYATSCGGAANPRGDEHPGRGGVRRPGCSSCHGVRSTRKSAAGTSGVTAGSALPGGSSVDPSREAASQPRSMRSASRHSSSVGSTHSLPGRRGRLIKLPQRFGDRQAMLFKHRDRQSARTSFGTKSVRSRGSVRPARPPADKRVSPVPERLGAHQGQPPIVYSLACARFTIACARRTYLLSARSRTVLTPSVSSRACASLLDRPKAVSGASASSANFIGPDSVPGGGVVSDLSVKASRWWSGVRPARARPGRCLAAAHCSGARCWSRVATRSAARLVPDRGQRRCRP
jgi:hypothetical protein